MVKMKKRRTTAAFCAYIPLLQVEEVINILIFVFKIIYIHQFKDYELHHHPTTRKFIDQSPKIALSWKNYLPLAMKFLPPSPHSQPVSAFLPPPILQHSNIQLIFRSVSFCLLFPYFLRVG